LSDDAPSTFRLISASSRGARSRSCCSSWSRTSESGRIYGAARSG